MTTLPAPTSAFADGQMREDGAIDTDSAAFFQGWAAHAERAERVRVVGDRYTGGDEDVVLDGGELSDVTVAVDLDVVADDAAVIDDGVVPDAQVVADAIFLADDDIVTGFEVVADGGAGIDDRVRADACVRRRGSAANREWGGRCGN